MSAGDVRLSIEKERNSSIRSTLNGSTANQPIGYQIINSVEIENHSAAGSTLNGSTANQPIRYQIINYVEIENHSSARSAVNGSTANQPITYHIVNGVVFLVIHKLNYRPGMSSGSCSLQNYMSVSPL